MPYHVTDKDNGIEIWKSGTIKSKSQGRDRRRKMRDHIDRIGSEQRNDWVDRKRAVFAWSTFSRAKRYAERFIRPAIVEFECDGNAWCVENFVAEDIYREYSSESDDEAVQQLVNRSEPWNGKRDNELEVWMKPESVGDILGVYDEFGEPLEFDEPS